MADAADDAVTGNGTTDAVRNDEGDGSADFHVVARPMTDDERVAATTVDDVGVAVDDRRASAEVVRYEQPRPLIPGVDVPIIPDHREMQGMASMAVTLAGANAVPAALRDKPNDVFQILLTARDLGVAVTTGMREFHVIEGKVTLSPKVKMAMVNERGRREGWAIWPDPDNNAEVATWYATRADRPGLTFSSTFTMDEAKNVKVKANQTLDQKDNWQNYPKRMLSWRALGYLLDDVFPEVGTGLYSPDEMGAMTDEDGQVIDVQVADPLPGTKAPRNHGPREADPGDQSLAEADADAHTELGRRLAAITGEAREALVALWTKHNDEGRPALPTFATLRVRDLVKAKAMVDSIERQLAAGKFGEGAKAEWEAMTAPDDDEPTGGEPVAAPDPEPSPEGDGAADPDPEPVVEGEAELGPVCEACNARPGQDHDPRLHELADAVDAANAAKARVAPGGDEALAATVAAEVQAMSSVDVTKALTDRHYLPPRDQQAKRKALAVVLYAERGGHGAVAADFPKRTEPEPVESTEADADPPATLPLGNDRADLD